MFRVAPRGKKLRILPVSTATAQSRNDILPSADTPVRNGMSTKRGGEGEGVKGHSRLAGARSAALEALALTPAHGVRRGLARVAFQFHGSLGIIVLRYVTLYTGRNRAVSLARPGGPANTTPAARCNSRRFVGVSGASRLFGGRCRAGCRRC